MTPGSAMAKHPLNKPPFRRTREVLDLRAKLAELQDTLDAIRSGEVDALIVNGPNGNQVYSLKGAEQPYRAFIEQMGEGAVTLDPDGTILYANKRFAEMLDLPLEKIISTSFLQCVSTHDRPLVTSILANDILANSTVTLVAGENGSSRSIPVRIAVSTLESADVPARAVVVTDLTEQYEKKILTESLRKLQAGQAELEQQYAEVQAIRAKLEQANAAKDEFLAALSHELRTPLTPVLLTANALAVDPAVPAELRGDLEVIRRNVQLEARLIDDLLDLTRIARGKLQISTQPTDLHHTLDLALDICRSDGATRSLRFDSDFKATHACVEADAVRLQQIFWNLIRNAVKFTPSGVITVTTRNGPRNKKSPPSIIITISDTGIGLDKNSLRRIFNAFEQGSGEITRRFGGLGLGLTISKRLVELHGGAITAASKGPGKGATFTVTLPTIPSSASAQTPVASILPAASRNLRILLVEDHDDTRRNMTRLLSALQHTVMAAPDAATALKHAAKNPFDLVISDIGLPDESGIDLMKKLRARHQLRGICLSGYGMEDDIAKSREAGFVEHLVKPIEFQRLATAINRAAGRA